MIGSAFGIDTTTEENKVKLVQIELEAQKLVAEQMKAQAKINVVEAGSADKFVSRWRPFIGWVCGAAFSYHFIILPVLLFGTSMAGIKIELPQFDMGTLMPVLMGMLGLGAMRSFEKAKKIN